MQHSNKLTCKSYLQSLYLIISLEKIKVTRFYEFMNYEFMNYHTMNLNENVRKKFYKRNNSTFHWLYILDASRKISFNIHNDWSFMHCNRGS